MKGKLAYLMVFICLVTSVGVAEAQTQQLYIEGFSGEGDVNLVGWTGVYDANGSGGGIGSGIAWVWHKGSCQNLIYTTEYTVDTSVYSTIEFGYDLRRHSAYSSTPETSIAVQVGPNWYVSKIIYTSASTTFATQTLAYDPNKENWDTLNIATAVRGSTASADLSGDITGFGLYSHSGNVGGDCIAEYDNFTITGTIVDVSADSPLVEFDIADVPTNGSETIFVYASILDSNGTLVLDASDEVTFSVAGEASLASPATVNAEAGIATALVRVTDQPGLIMVTAASSGLNTDDVSIISR